MMIEPAPSGAVGEAEIGRDREGEMIEPAPPGAVGEAEIGRDREG